MVESTHTHFKVTCKYIPTNFSWFLNFLNFHIIFLNSNILSYIVQGKKYDTKEQILGDIGPHPIDYESVEEITLSGNSHGREACDYLASIIERPTPKLTTVNFNDMFVGRKREELPGSLEVLVRALMNKNIVHLNLSDNAFGPDGIKSFDFLLKEMASLKTLKVTNCGLGPVSLID